MHRPYRGGLALILFSATLLFVCLSWQRVEVAASADALLDLDRKAAAQLMREGKVSEAIELLAEITAKDDTSYSDHLMMAHAHELAKNPTAAIAEYRRVLELLPSTTRNPDERKARQEADKKVNQADPMAAKIDAAVEDQLHKLDALEREAIASHNMAALGRIFRLRGKTWMADKLKDRAFAEVFAFDKDGWQPAGLDVKQGQNYHCRAAGTWHVRPGGSSASIECTANGPKENRVPAYAPGLACGQLMAQVNGKFIMLGEDLVFTAPASGPLLLIEAENNGGDRLKNKGSLQVIIFAE